MIPAGKYRQFFSILILLGCIVGRANISFASAPDSSSPFPAYQGWVNDFEQLYTPEEQKALDSIILTFKKETGIEIAIATLGGDYCSSDDFVKYTIELGNYWGVGEEGKDNGVFIAISTVFRTMRINNGYGIEKQVSDEETRQIIEEEFLPSFKEGVYYKGTLNGLNALIELLRTKKWE